MNKGLLVTLGVIVAFIGLAVVAGFGMMVSTNNTCVTFETTLSAAKDNSAIYYDSFWKKVKEVAQVPQQYSKDMRETYVAVMDARYSGKDPLMNWITEANPNFDPQMYKQVQQVIESGRNDFRDTQKQMIDGVREYKTYIKKFPRNILAGFVGKPSADFKWDDYRPMTSDRTDEAFRTHKDEAVDVFNKGAAR